MKVILYLLLLVILSLLLHPELVSSAGTCTCTCCSGNFCTPTFQGQFSISSCSECGRDGCASQYASCPFSDQAGSSSASCSSSPSPSPSPSPPSPPSSSPASSWAGTYNVVSKCSSECCCLGGALIVTAESSSTALVTGRLVGQYCPTFEPIELRLENITPGDVIYSAMFGTSFKISRNGHKIAVDNTVDSVCSERAECVSGNCLQNTSGASLTSVNSYLVLVLLAVVVFLY